MNNLYSLETIFIVGQTYFGLKFVTKK